MKELGPEGLQAAVVHMARVYKWRIMHQLPAQNSKGQWRTATLGDVGYPDLTMVRGSRIVFAELKGDRGVISPAQQLWLDDLDVTCVEVYVWWPADWLDGTIERLLKHI